MSEVPLKSAGMGLPSVQVCHEGGINEQFGRAWRASYSFALTGFSRPHLPWGSLGTCNPKPFTVLPAYLLSERRYRIRLGGLLANLSHRKCLSSCFAKVNPRTNLSFFTLVIAKDTLTDLFGN